MPQRGTCEKKILIILLSIGLIILLLSSKRGQAEHGSNFDGHPWHQNVTIKVEDLHHPATRHLEQSFNIKDEIYQFKSFSRNRVHVLMSIDPNSVDLKLPSVHRTDKDFAIAWWRRHGSGRVFYTALGHRPEVWQDERFQQHLLGALRWVMRL